MRPPTRRRFPFRLPSGLLATVVLLSSCTVAHNYLEPTGPRYAGHPADPPPKPPDLAGPAGSAMVLRGDSDGSGPVLRVVTFNIQFARRIDAAIRLLRTDPHLRAADVLCLQEMDAPGVERIAEALGLHFVYYPATRHPMTGRDFGPAILSRRPIRDDRKILLPHLAALGRTQRIAVAGTIDVDGLPVRLYSVHFATWLDNLPMRRWRQAATVRDDARGHHGPVVVAGDLNQESLGAVFAGAGFAWPTKEIGATTRGLALDHIFVRGGQTAADGGLRPAGVVRDNLGSSDHRPVWAVIRLERNGRALGRPRERGWGRPAAD